MQSTLPPNSMLSRSFQSLEAQLLKTLNFIKKASIKKNGQVFKLQQLPWYLLLGMPGSGKTTLLAKSNIHFIVGKQTNPANFKTISPSQTCHWWITPESVLVDVPGNYLLMDKKNLGNKIWQYLLCLIEDRRGKGGLGGVVITISVTDLVDKKSHPELIDTLKNAIKDVKDQFGQTVPFYVSITKCDLLPGFLDFFNDSSTDELIQAWGIPISDQIADESIVEIFSTRFNALIKRINNQVIWRLHQERNHFVKAYIKDFPFQIERVKEEFMKLLKMFADVDCHFALKGVYLTSATQDHMPSHISPLIDIVPADNLQQLLKIMYIPDNTRRPYFVKQFILQGIMQ